MTPSRSQTSTTSLVRLARSRRLWLDSRQMPSSSPFWLTSMKTRDGQDQHARAARHHQRGPGRGRSGQAVADHHHGGHGRGQRGDDGGGGRARGPAGPAAPRRPATGPRRAAAPRPARPAAGRRRPGARPAPAGPRPARRPTSHREQGQVGQHDPPPGRGDQGQQGAQHGQVGQRVDEGEQEGARPVAGPVELRAEQGDPADHQQGDRHDVAVGQPGQDRAGRARQCPRAPSGADAAARTSGLRPGR